MTKREFEQWAHSRGWARDKWGHYQKTLSGKDYRFKLSSTAVRYEVKVHHEGTRYSEPSSEWIRLRSGYLSKLKVSPDGKLTGLR